MSKKISELNSATELNNEDIFVVNQEEETKSVTKEIAFSDINEKLEQVLGVEQYDNSSTYNVGEYCIYENLLYVCTTEIETPEDFNSNHWEEQSVLEKTDNIKNNLNTIQTNVNQLMGGNSWTKISNTYGDLYYKKISNNIYVLRGAFSGFSNNFSITLPFTITYQQVFLMAGSGTYYTKAYINANTNQITIAAGTGSSSTTYNLSAWIILN